MGEMLWIARRGATIMVSDETEEIRAMYEKASVARSPEIHSSVDFAPAGGSGA